MMLNYVKLMIENKGLSFDEARSFVEGLLKGVVDPMQASAVLALLAYKGESGEEIAGVVNSMLGSSDNLIERPAEILLDCCGTGGSGTHKLNVSSAVGVLCAYLGVDVAKHGNRSASSRSGSADVFEAMGWPLDIGVDKILQVFKGRHFAFLFAPKFFPAMKYAAPIRKALGIRSVFNLAGPLSNPMGANVQLLGVSSLADMKRISRAVANLDKKRVLIVHSKEGYDEISPLRETFAVLTEAGSIKEEFIISPGDFIKSGLVPAELKGKGVSYNAEMMKMLFKGKGAGAYVEAVAINSAYALYISERVDSPKAGYELAKETLGKDVLYEFWNSILSDLQQ